MREVPTHAQGRDGRVEGSTGKLKRASDNSDATILAFLGATAEVGEDSLQPPQQLECGVASRHRLSELLLISSELY